MASICRSGKNGARLAISNSAVVRSAVLAWRNCFVTTGVEADLVRRLVLPDVQALVRKEADSALSIELENLQEKLAAGIVIGSVSLQQ